MLVSAASGAFTASAWRSSRYFTGFPAGGSEGRCRFRKLTELVHAPEFRYRGRHRQRVVSQLNSQGSARIAHPTSVTASVCIDNEEEARRLRERADELTVYTLRMMTGYSRGSDLNDPNAVVFVCLIGEEGRSILHTIGQFNDPRDVQQTMREVCHVLDEKAGANCAFVLATGEAERAEGKADDDRSAVASSVDGRKVGRAGAEPVVRRRFQGGHVDEIFFMGPDVGTITGVLIGPSQGSWYLDEMDVSSSRNASCTRFVCRQKLGEGGEQSAAYMQPVPLGAVVRGSGSATSVLSQEQSNLMMAVGLAEYRNLKARLLITTAVLTVCGSAVAGLAGGLEAAECFATGGAVGMLYQWLLQQGVEAMDDGSSPPVTTSPSVVPVLFEDGPALAAAPAAKSGTPGAVPSWKRKLGQVAGSSAFRLLYLGCCALGGAWAVHHLLPQHVELLGQMSPEQAQKVLGQRESWSLFTGLLGFWMYKAALIAVAIVPPLEEEASLRLRSLRE